MLLLFQDIRALLFFIALILYGFVGSPTPDQLGWVEIIVFTFLLLSLNFSLLKNFFVRSKWFTVRWLNTSFLLIIYAVTVPTIISLGQVTDQYELIRDLVAFSFLVLPFFMLPFFKDHAVRQRVFIFGALGIALLFTLRTIWVNYIQTPTDDFKVLYLTNSPLILWGALYCITQGGYTITRSYGVRSFIVGSLVLLVLALAISSMIVETQRAFLMATAITIFVTVICVFVRAPHKGAMILAAAGVFYLAFPDLLNDVGGLAWQKTQLVGFNRRIDEWLAVWQVIAYHPVSLFFGLGWGQDFASPAVANIHVTYTHSLLSFMLLKTGLIGFILTILYVISILREILNIYLRDGYVALAYFWPFVIPVFFYASYKSFDFGLLLTLILMTTIKQNYPQYRDKT